MRTVVRQGVFETNSSSEHALIVFEDQGTQDAWMSDPDLFLDLREADWLDELDEPDVFIVDSRLVIRRGDGAWQEAMEERVEWHNRELAEPCGLDLATCVEDFSSDPTEVAINMKIVPSNYWQDGDYGGWGVSCFEYEVGEWSNDDAKRYYEEGREILSIYIGSDN